MCSVHNTMCGTSFFAELFHIENVGLNTITIVGFRPPQSKWYLSVNEFLGVPEKHPKFVPESQVHVSIIAIANSIGPC